MKNILPTTAAFKKYRLVLLACFFSAYLHAQHIAESFEGQFFPPPGWTVGPFGVFLWDDHIGDASQGYQSATGGNVAGYGLDSGLITPPIMLEAGQQVEITFDYTVTETDGTPAKFMVYTGPTNEPFAEQLLLDEIILTETQPYTSHTVTFTAEETRDHYFIFYGRSEIHHIFRMYLDKIVIQDKNGCQTPSGISISALTAGSALLDWAGDSSAAGWQVQVTRGALPTEGKWIDVDADQAPLSGLIPGSDYTAYIRAQCSEGNSTFGSIGFTTPCADIFTAPFTTGFVSQDIPGCWTQEGDTGWKFNTYAEYDAAGAGDRTLFQGYTHYAWVDGSQNTNGKKAALLSPGVDISGLEEPALEFYAYSSNTVDGTYNELLVELYNGTAWQPAATLAASSGGWKFYSIGLSDIQDVVQARFTVTGQGDTTYYNDVLLDDISFREKTTCFLPNGVTTDFITDEAITFSWEPSNEGNTADIAYVPISQDFDGTPAETGVTSPYTITGLQPATYYNIYIRGNCGGDAGEWYGPYQVQTDCEVYVPSYEQGFDADTFPPYDYYHPGYPTCWSEGWGGSLATGPEDFNAGDWKPNPSAQSGGTTNSQSVSINLEGSQANSWLLSPLFDLSGGTYEAKVKIAIASTSPAPVTTAMGADDEVHLLYTENGLNWQSIKAWSGLSSGYHTAVIPLDGIDSGNVRFAFWTSEGNPDHVAYQFHVDNLEIRPKVICVEPVNLTVYGLTDQSAILSWENPGIAGSWSVAVVPAGIAPVESDWVLVTEVPYLRTGLDANTTYDFYARSVCSVSNDIITGPYTFTTRCTPLVAPYSEPFTEMLMLPSCWKDDPTPFDFQLFMVYFWQISTAATAEAAEAGDHTPGGGTNYAWLNTVNFINGEKGSLTTPLVDIDALEKPALQFYLFSKNTIDDAKNDVRVEISNGGAWEELTTITSHTNGWAEHTIDLGAYAGTGPVTVRFAITVNANNGNPGYNQILIDDVSFMEMPDCPAPFNLQVSDVTENSAHVAWENAGDIGSWEVEYGPAGFTPGEGITVEVTAAEVLLSGLDDGLEYEVYVTALCNEAGTPVGPAAFTTVPEVVNGTAGPEMERLMFYPNPVTNMLNIEAPFVIDTVEVYNVFGQLVKQQQPGSAVTTLEVSTLSSGMYMVRAYSGEKLTTFKIVKK